MLGPDKSESSSCIDTVCRGNRERWKDRPAETGRTSRVGSPEPKQTVLFLHGHLGGISRSNRHNGTRHLRHRLDTTCRDRKNQEYNNQEQLHYLILPRERQCAPSEWRAGSRGSVPHFVCASNQSHPSHDVIPQAAHWAFTRICVTTIFTPVPLGVQTA